MPMKPPTSRRRSAEGAVVEVRLRDRQRLVALRTARPDEKGRPARSLTQRQVAAQVGISHGHYGDIEAGRRHPSRAVAERLATFFAVPLLDLCEVRSASAVEASGLQVDGEIGGGDEGEAVVAGDGDGSEGG